MSTGMPAKRFPAGASSKYRPVGTGMAPVVKPGVGRRESEGELLKIPTEMPPLLHSCIQYTIGILGCNHPYLKRGP